MRMNTKNIKTKEDVIEFLNNEDKTMLKKVEVEFNFNGEVRKFNFERFKIEVPLVGGVKIK